jgi:hypothetical protein
MHRQQNVLHNILGLIGRLAGSCQTTPRTCPQHRRDRLQKTVIRDTVSRIGRPHQIGPLVITSAHTRS